MKKKLCFASAALSVLWVIGFFILGFASVIHTLLWLAAIVLVRSLFVCNDSSEMAVSKTNKGLMQDN